jgi:hypothetical protein
MRAVLRLNRREETRVKTITKALLHFAVVATTVVGFSGTALAQHRQGDGGYGTVSGQFNYGFWTGDSYNGYSLNAFGPGFGVRIGYTLDIGLYLGADFDYFFGDSQNIGVNLGALGGVGGSVSYNEYNFLGEVGYDFWIYRSGVLRPKLGLGVGIAHASGCAGANVLGVGGSTCQGNSKTGFAIAPGLQFLHVFDPVFLSLELRYQTAMVSDLPDPSGIILGFGVGAKF